MDFFYKNEFDMNPIFQPIHGHIYLSDTVIIIDFSIGKRENEKNKSRYLQLL